MINDYYNGQQCAKLILCNKHNHYITISDCQNGRHLKMAAGNNKFSIITTAVMFIVLKVFHKVPKYKQLLEPNIIH